MHIEISKTNQKYLKFYVLISSRYYVYTIFFFVLLVLLSSRIDPVTFLGIHSNIETGIHPRMYFKTTQSFFFPEFHAMLPMSFPFINLIYI